MQTIHIDHHLPSIA